MKRAGVLCTILVLLCPALALAQDGDAAMCNVAAVQASQEAGMPSEVLLALTLVETGRSADGKFLPWPWTVNMEGKGYWFDTRAEAVAFVTDAYAKGARSFDVGCFQINHRWHGEAFTSFEQMFDPLDNAKYAAKFMGELYAERASWEWAAGAYHSRNEEFAGKYRARYARIVANLPSTSQDIDHDLPVVVASSNQAAPIIEPRLSTWSPFQPIDTTPAPSHNGSLAGGLLSGNATPLLTQSNGSLF